MICPGTSLYPHSLDDKILCLCKLHYFCPLYSDKQQEREGNLTRSLYLMLQCNKNIPDRKLVQTLGVIFCHCFLHHPLAIRARESLLLGFYLYFWSVTLKSVRSFAQYIPQCWKTIQNVHLLKIIMPWYYTPFHKSRLGTRSRNWSGFPAVHRIRVTAESGSLFSRRILLCLNSLINTKCHIVGFTAKLKFAVYKYTVFKTPDSSNHCSQNFK